MGLLAHSPVRPSWPQVRMFFSDPRAASVVHFVPFHPPVRSAPKMPSSCSSVSPVSGLSLCTKNTGLGVEPLGSLNDPCANLISSGGYPNTASNPLRSDRHQLCPMYPISSLPATSPL